MSRSNGPQGQERGGQPQHWQQPAAELDPAVQQAYAAAQAAARPRYPQQGFGNVQGQPQYAPQAPAYPPQPAYQPTPQPPADHGYYNAAPAAPASPQSYQPVFDRYSPTADAGQRGYDPRQQPQVRPQQPVQPAYAPMPPAAQPSLYDSHAQPRGAVYDQWPQAGAPAAPAPAARGYDFSNYMPSAPAAPPHQSPRQPALQQPPLHVPQHPTQYAESQHEEPQWQPAGALDRGDQYAGQQPAYAGEPAAYDQNQHQYPAEQSGQLQNAADHGYDDQDVPDYEEDEPRRGRRGLVMVSALVGAIALGGGLAFAYKKFVRPGSDGVQVAKVQAPKGPAKTQPADPGGRQFPNQDSKLQNRLGDGSAPVAPAADVEGGVKRVQTMQIGRDGSVSAPPPVPGMVVVQPQAPQPVMQAALEAPPTAPIATAPVAPIAAPPRPAAIAPQPRVPVPVVNAAPPEPAALVPAAPKKQALKKAPVARDDLVASAPGGATAAAAPVTTAPAKLGGGGYVAVLASKGSKADAQRANTDMEQRFDVLKGKIFDVQEANLTAQGKGVVYRSVVGPPGSLAYATGICGQLKAVGHADCWPVKY